MQGMRMRRCAAGALWFIAACSSGGNDTDAMAGARDAGPSADGGASGSGTSGAGAGTTGGAGSAGTPAIPGVLALRIEPTELTIEDDGVAPGENATFRAIGRFDD